MYMIVYDCICRICDYVCIKSRPPSLTLTTLNPGLDFCVIFCIIQNLSPQALA